MKLSVAMIVKNEEEMLARCLETVLEADEIIVCDTGSEDKTVEIAKTFTDNVYTDFKWIDHFGKARQHSKDKCTGDWILSIDADEVLDCTIEHVKEEIAKAEKAGLSLVNVNVTAENNTGTNVFPRVYKNIPEVTWHGAAHNYLHLNGKHAKDCYPSDITIKFGYSPAHQKDPDRTLRILKGAIEKDPELTRERYYLAREYFYRKNWAKCIEHLDEYIPRSRFIGERNDAWLMKAYCLGGQKKYNEACDAAWQAIKYNANFKEALMFIANHMDATNKERWKSFAELADNRHVLFVRDPK